MNLNTYAQKHPYATVTLFFESADGATGTLVLPAGQVADLENLSGRVFPPDGTTAASLGWDAPYWYATECVGWAKGRA